MQRPNRRQSGFTIVEVLVAILLFAIVVLAILAPLTGLFGLTNKSAQQAIETIKGQWQNPSRNQYDLNCVAGPLTSASADPAVDIRDGDAQGTFQVIPVALTVGTTATCPPSGTATPGPPMREVTVTATVNGSTAKLVVEVAR